MTLASDGGSLGTDRAGFDALKMPCDHGAEMAAEVSASVTLEPQERILRSWPAELARADGRAEAVGRLVVTSHRVTFYRRAGLLRGGRLESAPLFSRRLEDLRTVGSHPYSMNIGYGDRIEIPGVDVDGQGFRLNREGSSEETRTAIEAARLARRAEIGSPLE